jgi:hypothetical protein
MDRYIAWHYTNKLNGIREQIKDEYPLVDLEKDIISITYDTNHGCYVVFFLGGNVKELQNG